jgi:hypothetical protein
LPFRFRSTFTRRQFVKHLGMSGILTTAPSIFAAPSGLTPNPVQPGVFTLLPLGSVQPKGWLKSQLQIQANGLSGHLDEAWPDVGPTSGWLGGKGESWERGPYFLDGLIPLAYLLDDEHLKAKARSLNDTFAFTRRTYAS